MPLFLDVFGYDGLAFAHFHDILIHFRFYFCVL